MGYLKVTIPSVTIPSSFVVLYVPLQLRGEESVFWSPSVGLSINLEHGLGMKKLALN